MYGRTFIFDENFQVNLSVVLEIFHVFNFRGTRPRKLFNLEHFPIYGYVVIDFNIAKSCTKAARAITSE